VDRSCGDEPGESPVTEDEVTDPAVEASPSAPTPLTATTDAAFAAVLTEGDYCSDTIAQFADEHEGKVIEFDGSIVAMNNHDGYTTRYDILIAAGDYSETSQPGPAFQFSDVNTTSDLHWTNTNTTNGSNLHLVAEIDGFDASACLLAIEPVATSFR